MNRMLLVSALAILTATSPIASTADPTRDAKRWIGTWAAAPQPIQPVSAVSFRNQSVRLIVHVSAGGVTVRIKISNIYGDQPLIVGGAHVARRAAGADIEPASDRTLMFHGRASVHVPARSMVVSDPVALDVPALSDLAISLFFPEATAARTAHELALQTSYVSAEGGDFTASEKFPVAKPIRTWPFLTGIDVAASPIGVAIVAFGASLTDGDGTTRDANARWPDVLAERLQQRANRRADVGVLNEGIIGNRLLNDSPSLAAGGLFGTLLGEAGLARFERDVLAQAGVKYVILGLGINDIAFPGSLTPATEAITAEALIRGYRQILARAHKKGIRVIGTTNAPFEHAFLALPAPARPVTFFTAEKEAVRQQVNDWIRHSGAFDGVVDLDEVLRDPNHPTQILSAYDSGDHLHPNNAGCLAEGKAFPLTLFDRP